MPDTSTKLQTSSRPSLKEVTSIEQFQQIDLRVGTVIEAKLNSKARKPAFAILVDLGVFGIKKTSAQLTENYKEEDLIGKKVIVVANFPSKRIAGVKSEVLILGALDNTTGTHLLSIDSIVENGTTIA